MDNKLTELHHLIQKESGNMVEIIAITHVDYKKYYMV
ncbi:HNH/ENDO VII family nuclease [Rummeliibacillus pycnus]|nr:HNH/ENDO VII family nuclease [Rummeliibacillus pycnus]